MNYSRKTIFCYGDSNTYGYDPRSYLGDRYPESVRWTGILKKKTGLDIQNAGVPGRKIPVFQYEMNRVADQIRNCLFPLRLLIMLGSNDLLNGTSAPEVADHMKVFLEFLLRQDIFLTGGMEILLISPPGMKAGEWTDPHILAESALLGRNMHRIITDLCSSVPGNITPETLAFADAGSWELPVTFDGVHLSEEGHRMFAEKILSFLQ